MTTSRVQTTIISRAGDNRRLIYWIFGLFVVPVLLVAMFRDYFGPLREMLRIIFLCSFAAGFVGIVTLIKRRREQWQEQVARTFSQMARGELRHFDVARGLGFAIGVGDDTLVILRKKTAFAIPLELIRGWEWKVEGYDRVTVSGFGPAIFGAAMQAGAHNTSARHQAEQASGLFVRAASIDHPVIHFQTTDVKLLQRWHEILLQTLGDDFSEQQVA